MKYSTKKFAIYYLEQDSLSFLVTQSAGTFWGPQSSASSSQSLADRSQIVQNLSPTEIKSIQN